MPRSIFLNNISPYVLLDAAFIFKRHDFLIPVGELINIRDTNIDGVKGGVSTGIHSVSSLHLYDHSSA